MFRFNPLISTAWHYQQRERYGSKQDLKSPLSTVSKTGSILKRTILLISVFQCTFFIVFYHSHEILNKIHRETYSIDKLKVVVAQEEPLDVTNAITKVIMAGALR